ncbi:MAG TPA: succinyl-diaminopimelate desuccinylase [Gammaproteobacteria bacterium]|nr:succinyl-diaminopimelate desuccinylase [Gammaproteobacteria bacterium]
MSALDLAKLLISEPSITPSDKNCQNIIKKILAPLGFSLETLPFGDVTNLWAKHGQGTPTLCFAGHTDVVPCGDLSQWDFPPFTPTLHQGKLYGRGAADMKGGLAAMIAASQNYIQKHPRHPGTLAFLITSDEEGLAEKGTQQVLHHLTTRNEKIDYCVLGEPSSIAFVADTLKIGSRGSLTGHITIFGKQGHVALPHLAKNPIHQALLALQALTERDWDNGDKHHPNFPATQLQLANIHAGEGATNVIPGELKVQFNIRFSPHLDVEKLKFSVEEVLLFYKLNFQIKWVLAAHPFYTDPKSKLIQTTALAIKNITQKSPFFSTDGGTSDGRFFTPLGTEVVELGPINASIHQINEHVEISSLETLTAIYEEIIALIFKHSS